MDIGAESKHATLNIIKFNVRPLDLFVSQQQGLPLRYSFLALSWGTTSDIDIGSEKFVYYHEASRVW
jgi:hypothetical protein